MAHPLPEPLDPLSRYRREGDRVCIELRLRTTKQLFDARDPSPFRDRDLDDDAVDYLVSAAEEIPRREVIALSIRFAEEDPTLAPDAIVQAIRQHFAYEISRSRRQIRGMFQLAQLGAVVAIVVLAVCLGLAELLSRRSAGALSRLVREGLVIVGWVALWRPLENALYDWWPHASRLRVLRRIAEADIDVRFEG